jgi:hypothetical protein
MKKLGRTGAGCEGKAASVLTLPLLGDKATELPNENGFPALNAVEGVLPLDAVKTGTACPKEDMEGKAEPLLGDKATELPNENGRRFFGGRFGFKEYAETV